MLRIAVALGVLMVLAAAAMLALRSMAGPDFAPRGLQHTGAEVEVPAPEPVANPSPRDVERRDAEPTVRDFGFPTGTGIAGLVRDREGNPVGRAAVWLLRADRDERIDSARSDASGRYALPLGLDADLDVPAFRVAAHHPAHGLADPVVVERPADGEIARVDPVVRHAGLSIAGMVVGPGGQAMPDHPIALAWVDGPPHTLVDWRAGCDGAEVRTDAEGHFAARGLRVGTWEIDFEASDVPLGFDAELPWLRTEVQAGTSGVVLTVPFVRIDVEVVGADGEAVVAQRVVACASSPSDATAAAARFAAGETAIDPAYRRGRRQRDDVDRTSFWVAPGAFLSLSATCGHLPGVVGMVIAHDTAVQGCVVQVGGSATSGVRLSVAGPNGARPSQVLFRAVRPDGLRIAPPGLEDLGSGWRRLPDDGLLALPPGTVEIGVLGNPFRVERSWLPRDLLPARVEVRVPAGGGFADQAVQLRTGAFVEVAIDQEESVTDTARSAWRDERAPDGTPILRATASVEVGRGPEVTLRLVWVADGGEWIPVLGVPHRPGERVILRALGVFEPGRSRFAMQTWRPASVDIAAGWSVDLQPGRNRLRLHLDADGVLSWGGR